MSSNLGLLLSPVMAHGHDRQDSERAESSSVASVSVIEEARVTNVTETDAIAKPSHCTETCCEPWHSDKMPLMVCRANVVHTSTREPANCRQAKHLAVIAESRSK